MNQYVIAIIIVLALVFYWSNRRLVAYLCSSYAYFKLSKYSGEDSSTHWISFVPYVRYVKMARLLNKGNRITWLEPLIVIASVVGVVSLLPFDIPLFGTVIVVCHWLLSCFRLYVVCVCSLMVEGKYNIIAIIASIFGFDWLALLWITRNIS